MRSTIVLTAPMLALLACSSGSSEEPSTTTPREFRAPEPCELVPSVKPLCDFEPLAGAPDPSLGGAGGMGGAGSTPDDDATGERDVDPTTACLISQDVLLRCPTRVGGLAMGRGPAEELDLVVARLGADALDEHASLIPNDRVYLQALRLTPDGEQHTSTDVLPPFPASEGVFTLLPGSSSNDTLLLHHRQSGESPPGTITLLPFLGGDPTDTATTAPLLSRPRAFVTSQGEGVYFNHAFNAGLFVTAGLPHSPRHGAVTDGGTAAVVDATSTGQLRAVVRDALRLRLLGGDDLAQELWAMDVSNGVNLPSVDLLHVPGEQDDRAVVLSRDGDAESPNIRFVDADGTASQPVYIGSSSSTCDSFSVGFTCDDCPVGTTCDARRDVLREIRLFQADGRVFAAYVATVRTEVREYERHVTPIIDVGCVCDTKSVGSEETADILVVLELEPPSTPEGNPVVTRWMRRSIAEPRGAVYPLFSRGPQGTLDLLYGTHLARFEDGQRTFPNDPIEYRVIRVDPIGASR